jgi:hypothetical protein
VVTPGASFVPPVRFVTRDDRRLALRKRSYD